MFIIYLYCCCRAEINEKKYREAMQEKITEKQATNKVRNQLKAAQTTIKRLKEKEEKVQELKRSVRELEDVEGRQKAAEER